MSESSNFNSEQTVRASDGSGIGEGTLALQTQYQGILHRNQLRWNASRELKRCLGVGGQGRVYLSHRFGAEHFSLPVALKIFSPERFKSVESYHEEMGRIVRVASQVARVQHDNVVDVNDFIEVEGIIVMEMEWVDGYDLRCLLTPAIMQQVRNHASHQHWQELNREVVTAGQTQPRLKPGMAIAIIRECLHGLSSLHKVDIVHNDLKPSNIMLKRSGNVKLIDTGSAFSVSDAPRITACTPEFAAPEVLDGSKATMQSDLASLGYVLLEMLSGWRTFRGMSLNEMLEAKKNIFNTLPTILPAEEFAYFELLLPLLRRLVAPNPEERFATAEQADQDADGAAAFEQQLVKGDLSHSYETDIQKWIAEVDSEDDDNDGLDSTRTLTQ